MSDDLVKRLQDPPFGTETSERNLMAKAAAALVAKDAEIARLREALRRVVNADRDIDGDISATWDERNAAMASAEDIIAALKLARS